MFKKNTQLNRLRKPTKKAKDLMSEQNKNLFYTNIFRQKDRSYDTQLELDRLKSAMPSVEINTRIKTLTKK